MKSRLKIWMMFLISITCISCSKDAEFEPETNGKSGLMTRNLGYTDMIVPEPEPEPDPDLVNQTPLDSTKFVKIVSIKGGSVNPLNVGTYVLPDESPFFDVVTIDDGYFMEMSDNKPDFVAGLGYYEERIKPLQDMGIKVLYTVRSGNGRWGFGNLPDDLIDELSDQIRDFIVKHKLNGVNLVDLDADYEDAYQPRPNDESYSKMVLALRKKLSDKRIITVRHVGYSSTLSAEAIQAIDRIWTNTLGMSTYSSMPSLPGLTRRKWLPMRIPATNSYSSILYKRLHILCGRALNEEMGGLFFSELSTNDISPMLTSIAEPIYGDSLTISRTQVYEY